MRNRAFTLLDLCIVLVMGLMLFGAVLPSALCRSTVVIKALKINNKPAAQSDVTIERKGLVAPIHFSE